MQDEEGESAMLRKTNLNSGHKFQLRGRSESLTNVAFENLMHLKKKSFRNFQPKFEHKSFFFKIQELQSCMGSPLGTSRRHLSYRIGQRM